MEREFSILYLVIEKYVKDFHPVSSKELCEFISGEISPATIRAEMHRLENEGYLDHMYTSGGRIPTIMGYEFFVKKLLNSMGLLSTIGNPGRTKAYENSSRGCLRDMMDIVAIESKGICFVIRGDRIYYRGLKNIIKDINAIGPKTIQDMIEFIENEEHIFSLANLISNEKIYVMIGKKDGLSSDRLALFMSNIYLGGENAAVGIVSAIHTDYKRNIGIIYKIKNKVN